MAVVYGSRGIVKVSVTTDEGIVEIKDLYLHSISISKDHETGSMVITGYEGDITNGGSTKTRD